MRLTDGQTDISSRCSTVKTCTNVNKNYHGNKYYSNERKTRAV